VIASGPPMMSPRNDTIAPNEQGTYGWIRACCAQSLFRLQQGSAHKFFVGI
jgi:hypothetical protein